jgi:hypothetical protein
MVLTCNTSYSGGRDQEGGIQKPVQAKRSQYPISKKPITQKKRAGGGAQGVGPDYKPQYQKKKKKKKSI